VPKETRADLKMKGREALNQLKIVENQLINVYETNKAERVVDARELHDFLEVGDKFTQWMERRIEKYVFDEGLDFFTISGKSSGGRPTLDYLLKMDTAKEIAMVENNERGRQVRKYFIEVEKRFRSSTQPVMTIEDMIISQAESVKNLKQRVDNQEHEVSRLKLVVDNEVWVTEHQKNLIQEAVKRRVFTLKDEGYDTNFQAVYGALKRHFGVAKYDKIPRKNFETALKFIAGWYPPTRQSELSL
jgi:anti-repressor protein